MIYAGHLGHRSPRSRSPSRNLQDQKIADVLDITNILSIVDIVAIADLDIPCKQNVETPQNTDMPPNSPIWQFGAFQNFAKFEKNGKLWKQKYFVFPGRRKIGYLCVVVMCLTKVYKVTRSVQSYPGVQSSPG